MGFFAKLFGTGGGKGGPYAERVEASWRDWAEHSEAYLKSIDADGGRSIPSAVTAATDALRPDPSWVFGPGPDGQGHSITLSPGGNRNRSFLTEYRLEQAPELEGWTVNASRQPNPSVEGQKIEFGGAEICADEAWVQLDLDEESRLHSVTLGAPALAGLDESSVQRVGFLWLDEVLGENGTEDWLGGVEFGSERPDDAVALDVLRERILRERAEREWHVGSPLETFSSSQLPEPLGDFPGGDTVAGTTRHPGIIGKFLSAGGPFEDELEGAGAEFLFLMFPREHSPKGEEVAVRASLEEALEEALRTAAAGTVFGGAVGHRHGHVDFLAFDGTRARELGREVLDKAGLGSETRIEPFAE